MIGQVATITYNGLGYIAAASNKILIFFLPEVPFDSFTFLSKALGMPE